MDRNACVDLADDTRKVRFVGAFAGYTDIPLWNQLSHGVEDLGPYVFADSCGYVTVKRTDFVAFAEVSLFLCRTVSQ